MRILCLGHFVRPGEVGGMEEYFWTLLNGLAEQDCQLEVLLRRCAESRAREVLGDRMGRMRVRFVPDRGTRFFWESLHGSLRSHRADVIFAPNQFTPVMLGPKKPIVSTIQDVQYAVFPEYSSARKRAWLRAVHKRTLRHAAATVTISEFSRKEILELYGEKYTDRVVPIHVPIDWERIGRPRSEGQADQPTLLTVAAHFPHKNLPTIAHAMRRLVDSGVKARWILVGQPPRFLSRHGVGYPDMDALVSQLGLEDHVEVAGRLTDRELEQLMHSATALVMPSLYEGFGNVPAEALGIGLPVVSSSAGAIPEVTRGLALYVEDALDVVEWTNALEKVIRSPMQFTPSLADVQSVRDAYSPHRIAKQYMALFEAVALGGSPSASSMHPVPSSPGATRAEALANRHES
jgi:glycosyltransferase involved in cell wall biosynthesis